MALFETKCPKCGSASTKDISNKSEKDSTYKCKNCEHVWVVKKTGSFM
jgi:transposase-like protein